MDRRPISTPDRLHCMSLTGMACLMIVTFFISNIIGWWLEHGRRQRIVEKTKRLAANSDIKTPVTLSNPVLEIVPSLISALSEFSAKAFPDSIVIVRVLVTVTSEGVLPAPAVAVDTVVVRASVTSTCAKAIPGRGANSAGTQVPISR